MACGKQCKEYRSLKNELENTITGQNPVSECFGDIINNTSALERVENIPVDYCANCIYNHTKGTGYRITENKREEYARVLVKG